MRFTVVQTGARRGYAVPAILERAGMLERFYTDFCADVGLGRWLAKGRRLPVVGARLARLDNRRLPPEIVAKTRAIAPPLTVGFSGGHDLVRAARRDYQRGHRWTEKLVRAGFGEATHLYSMLSEAGAMIGAAKDRGLRVVCEVYILLSTERLLERERRDFPGWEPDVPDHAAIRAEHGYDNGGMLAHSDLLVCPSGAVRDDLVAHWGVDAARTALVPYGMDPRWLDLAPAPQRGRVLFVGTADLRKGIHYLALAAERLHTLGLRYEFRVAGHATNAVRAQGTCRHLTFLGRVPRDRIAEEFRTADVFVLPSLAEGSAEVTYEALASALPVVTTVAAGSVARDGIEGRIVPERNPAALADALAEIVEDRERRAAFSIAARARAADFTWERYAARLLAVLERTA